MSEKESSFFFFKSSLPVLNQYCSPLLQSLHLSATPFLSLSTFSISSSSPPSLPNALQYISGLLQALPLFCFREIPCSKPHADPPGSHATRHPATLNALLPNCDLLGPVLYAKHVLPHMLKPPMTKNLHKSKKQLHENAVLSCWLL